MIPAGANRSRPLGAIESFGLETNVRISIRKVVKNSS
jgi:hypothetical protein